MRCAPSSEDCYRSHEHVAWTCVRSSRVPLREAASRGQRDDSATVTIETAAYGAITAAHERVLRARLSPHRQDCVDFGRAIARSSPAAEKEELLRAVGAVTPLARPSRWQRWSVRRCARARALLNGVMCSQARTRELVVGASHRERALLSEANLLLCLIQRRAAARRVRARRCGARARDR